MQLLLWKLINISQLHWDCSISGIHFFKIRT